MPSAGFRQGNKVPVGRFLHVFAERIAVGMQDSLR